MTIPTLTANAGVYALEWGEENVRITMDRLDDHSHITTAEVTIKQKIEADWKHLHQARLNLTSTTARNTLARYLKDRVDTLDWGGLLEQACVKVLVKYREGEPVKKVGAQPINQTNRYLLHPFLLANQPNLFFGTQGAAKSTMAAKCALEIEGNTLWVDYEWSEDEVNLMISRLKDGMGLDPSIEIDYRFCAQPLADDILGIQRMALETKASLVIIDSVGPAVGGDPMDPAVVLRYFSALRSLRVTTLSIDHVAKEARGPFGSVYKMNCARNVWEVICGTRDEDTLSIGLHHRKVNSGPLQKSIGFKFTYTPESILPQAADARQIPEVVAGMSLADQIEVALVRGPMTPKELGDELGKKPNTISSTISQHKNRFVQLGAGKWGNKSSDRYLDHEEV